MARLDRLPLVPVSGFADVRAARGFRARLLGLAWLDEESAEPLLLERCRSVHTFGMRFSLDLVWLGVRGEVVRVDRAVAPNRLRSCPRARSVLELSAEARGGR